MWYLLPLTMANVNQNQVQKQIRQLRVISDEDMLAWMNFRSDSVWQFQYPVEKKVILLMVWNGTACIKVFIYLKSVLRWWSELSEFCSWHSWSEKLQKNYIAIRNQNTLQKRIAFSRLLEENQWKKYWQCSVEISHSIFYFETTFCLDFFSLCISFFATT